MKLFLIRHGQSEANVQGVISDVITRPVSITKIGVTQVQKSAKKLKDKNIEIIYASPFLRTIQTAEIISKEIEVPIIQDIRLHEYKTGMDGAVAADFEKIKKYDPNWRPQGGESYTDMLVRLNSFLKMLKESNHKTVAIVSHMDPLLALQAIILKKSYEEYLQMSQDNAEIVELVY